MPAYKHIFFDLDNTLLDFRANAYETFHNIFTEMDLFGRIPDFGKFIAVYEHYNEEMWSRYRKGQIKKDDMRTERMVLTFRDMGIDDASLAQQVGDIYLRSAPKKTNLFPQVDETLTYLSGKYKLYILTNGFAEVQIQKIRNSGLQDYFARLFIAELVGHQKPDRRFFDYAIKSIHAHKAESLMVGDDPEADIIGAAHAGINQVFFNPHSRSCSIQPTWEIKAFGELTSFL